MLYKFTVSATVCIINHSMKCYYSILIVFVYLALKLSNLYFQVHASMLSLAAQMHAVHEEVKAQKEHYLNYRRIFQGDVTDIFEKRRRAAQVKTGLIPMNAVGPQPFRPGTGPS